jgi:hypothetical protein
LHVGTALLNRDDWPAQIAETWGMGSSSKRAVRDSEVPLEKAVSDYIRGMPFIWVAIDDLPGPESDRGCIEWNAIALLSNYGAGAPVDLPTESWLGRYAEATAIQRSGLWNVNHVADDYDPAFLDTLQTYVSGME